MGAGGGRRLDGLRRLRHRHRHRQVARAQLSTQHEIGRTVLGRPIIALHYPRRPGSPERAPVLLFGAIHGDEPLGVHCLVELGRELESEAPGRETWIVPVLNLDGLLGGSKNNARDVDLNRNFAASNWAAEHAAGYSPGRGPESEPETQALVRLIADSRATRLVALHSPFRVVNYDGSGRALAEAMGALNGYGASADIGYPTPGSLGSRYGRDLGLEVITLEIPLTSEAEAWSENRAALRLAVDLGP